MCFNEVASDRLSLQKDNKEQTGKLVFNVPTNTTIDFKLVFGAATFGLGWGIVHPYCINGGRRLRLDLLSPPTLTNTLL